MEECRKDLGSQSIKRLAFRKGRLAAQEIAILKSGDICASVESFLEGFFSEFVSKNELSREQILELVQIPLTVAIRHIKRSGGR